jgi:hypothetical protein
MEENIPYNDEFDDVESSSEDDEDDDAQVC